MQASDPLILTPCSGPVKAAGPGNAEERPVAKPRRDGRP